VDDSNRALLINEDTVLRGEISNGGRIEICGYVEGNIVGDDLIIRPSGRCYGTIDVQSAEIYGTLQGEIAVRQLMSVRSTGSVTGNVQYGRLAMELGGDLTAELHNVPPTIGGDLDLAVAKGRSVRITLQDLNALDPDDKSHDLTFTVSGARNGRVTLANEPERAVETFTQADLERGSVQFMHDGTDAQDASFDVVVADKAGAISGAAQTVKVAVRGHA
jgi:cytoskeletal protein CcmA (bactofilin family)